MVDMHLVRDVCSTPSCPYCDQPVLDGPTEFFGANLMHRECYQKLGEELTALDSSPRNRPKIVIGRCPNKNDVEYSYQKYYGYSKPH